MSILVQFFFFWPQITTRMQVCHDACMFKHWNITLKCESQWLGKAIFKFMGYLDESHPKHVTVYPSPSWWDSAICHMVRIPDAGRAAAPDRRRRTPPRLGRHCQCHRHSDQNRRRAGPRPDEPPGGHELELECRVLALRLRDWLRVTAARSTGTRDPGRTRSGLGPSSRDVFWFENASDLGAKPCAI